MKKFGDWGKWDEERKLYLKMEVGKETIFKKHNKKAQAYGDSSSFSFFYWIMTGHFSKNDVAYQNWHNSMNYH